MTVLLFFLFFSCAAALQSQLQVIHDEEANLFVAVPAEYDAVVVMMHGLGDTGKSFIGLAEIMSKQLPKVKFVLPSAAVQPVTLNGGKLMSSWYDIISLQDKDGGNCDGLLESSERIRQILEKEHSEGIPYNRIVLSGFSQGGALSLFTGLQLKAEQQLAGIVCMSGYMPCPRKFTLEPAVKDTPVLHLHGLEDRTVQFKWAELTRKGLQQMDVLNYRLETFTQLGHSINAEGLSLVSKFIHQCLNTVNENEHRGSKAQDENSTRQHKTEL